MEILDLGKQSKLLIFGGSCSNLQATQKLKEVADKEGIDSSNIICTGDSVAYCGQPEETISLLKEWNIHSIFGNVEEQLRNHANTCNCNFESGTECDVLSQKWYPFAKSKISEESVAWMKTLPRTISFEIAGKKAIVIHGGFSEISKYIFSSTPWEEKKADFDSAKSDIIIAGHAGIPFSQVKDGKLWVNAGVIGVPANDGTSRVWYAIIEEKGDCIEVIHKWFEYDFSSTVENMNKEGLPPEYAQTLRTGLWPNCDILPEKETSEQGKKLELGSISFF